MKLTKSNLANQPKYQTNLAFYRPVSTNKIK